VKNIRRNYKGLNDEQLMECIQRGDTSGFDELYDRYSQRLLFYFYRALRGDEEKAQDLLQEVFVKVVERPSLFRSGNRFSTWIFTVADNLCKNEYRRLQVRKIIENDVDIDAIVHSSKGECHDMEQKVDQRAFENAVFEELETIGPDHRSAVLLRYQQDLSIKEISEILKCPEGTVKSRLFHTIRKLASKLNAFSPHNTEV